MPASYTSGRSPYLCRHPTCRTSSQRSHIASSRPSTLPLASMEHGHLLHSTFTCPPSGNAWRLISMHPFVPAAQQLIISSDDNNKKCGALGGSPMECGVVGQHHETPHFNPRHGTHPPGMTLPRTAWVRLNCLCTGVGRFRPCLHKWGSRTTAI